MSIITPIAETADSVTLSSADLQTLMKAASGTVEAVTLPRAEFEMLIAALDLAADIGALNAAVAEEARIGAKAARNDYLPVELVERMLAGETPLKVWREHRKLTVAALATASGVGGSYISEIETGKKPGSIDALAKIAKALGLTIDDLVAETGE